ncbi:MAG: ABC transporter ATP-binding protein [Anaerolineaceae bacterium]|nr:ABC transporter ATP-binding protein [Anaerolineaceae bacterium]
MGFIMDGLDAEEYDRRYNDRELIRRILGYFFPEGRRMLIASVMVIGFTIAGALLPVIISRVLDDIQADIQTNVVWLSTLILILVGVMSWAFRGLRSWLVHISVGNVTLQLRDDVFRAVMKRDLSFYDEVPTGKVVSRVASDTQAFSSVVTLSVELLAQTLYVVMLVGILFSVHLELTLYTIALMPLILGVSWGFRLIARKTVTQSRRINAEVNQHIQETVNGIRVIKTFRQENAIYEEFLAVNRRSFLINLRNGFVFSSIFPILITIAGLGTAMIVYAGGLAAQAGSLTTGEWYLFIQAINAFWFPLTSIASFWSQFQLGLAASERVFALIDAEPKVKQIDSLRLQQFQGQIRFEQVDFAYLEQEPVLQDFSLTIAAGETLALVGHTGSGKSSIGKLVARFYEFQGGSIFIDGTDIRSLDLEHYRSQLGIVTQTPFLFSGSVRDNIRYGQPDAADAEVERIANLVGNGDWIRTLSDGLATEVGERGSHISMGQRQLVALARVLLQNPKIVILDEATANVDPLTETLIQEGLETVMADRTAVVIAHRLSTIKNSDRIIVLREGEIIETGDHEDLLAAQGHYAELYNTYFRHQSLEYIHSVVV